MQFYANGRGETETGTSPPNHETRFSTTKGSWPKGTRSKLSRLLTDQVLRPQVGTTNPKLRRLETQWDVRSRTDVPMVDLTALQVQWINECSPTSSPLSTALLELIDLELWNETGGKDILEVETLFANWRQRRGPCIKARLSQYRDRIPSATAMF